jgi:hypothetical protein
MKIKLLTTFFAIIILISTSIASAADFICSGYDLKGNAVEIQILKETKKTSLRTVVRKLNGSKTIFHHIEAYAGDEGYEFGVNTSLFSAWIHEAPNMLNNGKTALSYFEGQNQNLNERAILTCN